MAASRCFECGNKSGNWIMKSGPREYKGEGYHFTLNVESAYCEKCGAPIYDREVEEKIREKAHKIIVEQRAKHGGMEKQEN